MRQVIEKEPATPRQLNPAIERDLETITLKCLSKSPEQRYQTSEELADELRRFSNGEPIHARPSSRPIRAYRWCKRNPIPTALIASVLAAFVLGAFAFTLYFCNKSTQIALAAKQRESLALGKAKQAAEENEATQSYLAKLNSIREGLASRRNGWSWKAEKALAAASKEKTPVTNPYDLRSLAATVVRLLS